MLFPLAKIVKWKTPYIGKKLGIEVLTEGVETKEQKDFLNSVGCHMFQGYYYDKPMPVSNFYKKYFDVC